jgi:hypothetical protein
VSTVSLLKLDANYDTSRGVHANTWVTQQLPKDHLLSMQRKRTLRLPEMLGVRWFGTIICVPCGALLLEQVLHAFLSSVFMLP